MKTSCFTNLLLILRGIRIIAEAVRGVRGLVLAVSLSGVALLGQTVSLTNTTRGGSSVFYIGDAWEFDITGAPSTAVSYAYSGDSPTGVGSTDGSGNLTITGYIYEGSEGCWNETWWVGASVASPDPISFCVYPAAESSCSIDTSGNVILFNVDVWDDLYYTVYSNTPYISTYVSGAQSQDWCPMYGGYVGDLYGSLTSSQTIFTSALDEWYTYDNGNRPGLYPDGTMYVPESYYPYADVAAFAFAAINITNGDLAWDSASVTLIVDWTVE